MNGARNDYAQYGNQNQKGSNYMFSHMRMLAFSCFNERISFGIPTQLWELGNGHGG